jgi:chaperonin GroEL
MGKGKVRGLVFQPHTFQAIQAGVNQIVNAIRPTLGPHPRLVAIEDISGKFAAEFLDSGGVIARRIIEVADRDADVGAMLIRQMLWQLHEQCADGTATAAVIFQSIFNQSLPYIAAGGNAMLLRQYLEKGMHVILAHLTAMTCPVQNDWQLRHIVETVCYDQEIAHLVAEAFAMVGAEGKVEVRAGHGRGVDKEYVEGMYWKSRLLTAQGQGSFERTIRLDDAAILLTDLEITEIDELLPALTLIVQAGVKKLVIVARSLSDTAIGFLRSNSRPDKFQVVAVGAPGAEVYQQVIDLEDLALLTGARPLVAAMGNTLNGFRVSDLGHARLFWAQQDAFGLVEGAGDPAAIGRRIAQLRDAAAECADIQKRKLLQDRIANLISGSMLLWVGGITETEIETRKILAERTVDSVRSALVGGVLPGSGASLIACQTPLRYLYNSSSDEHERTAYKILLRALEEPCRTIASNAGYDAGEIVRQLQLAGPGHVFDVRCGAVAEAAQSGIFDSADIQKSAVCTAIAGAAMALTIDVIYHRRIRLESTNP